jgi:pimeloyl-ACP methyl ester carboxylesterase
MWLRVDGSEVFAGTGGVSFDPAGRQVVFLHGAGMDHTVWQFPARYFANRGRAVLAPDLPGHGASDGPALATVAALAAWVDWLLAEVGFAAATLVGHSMGAAVALAAAAASSRVAGLALLGAALRMPVHPDLMAAAAADRREASDLVASWGHGGIGRMGGNPVPGLWLMEGARRLLEGAGRQVLATDLAACAGFDAAGLAARVRCPTLVLIGGEDRMTPPGAGEALAAAIPGARCVRLAGVGHMMMTERPDAVIDALAAFL